MSCFKLNAVLGDIILSGWDHLRSTGAAGLWQACLKTFWFPEWCTSRCCVDHSFAWMMNPHRAGQVCFRAPVVDPGYFDNSVPSSVVVLLHVDGRFRGASALSEGSGAVILSMCLGLVIGKSGELSAPIRFLDVGLLAKVGRFRKETNMHASLVLDSCLACVAARSSSRNYFNSNTWRVDSARCYCKSGPPRAFKSHCDAQSNLLLVTRVALQHVLASSS